jgi:hypothetical protein
MFENKQVDFRELAGTIEASVGGETYHVDEGAGRALRDVIKAVKASGGKGSVTIKFEVESENGGRTLSLKASIGRKMPEAKTFKVGFFTDAEGKLFRQDPYQQMLPTRLPDADERRGDAA